MVGYLFLGFSSNHGEVLASSATVDTACVLHMMIVGDGSTVTRAGAVC